MPGIKRNGRHSFQSIVALPAPFPAFIEAVRVPEHLLREELYHRLRGQGYKLMHATCCARIAGLFVLRVSVAFKGAVNHPLAAIEGPRKVGFGGE